MSVQWQEIALAWLLVGALLLNYIQYHVSLKALVENYVTEHDGGPYELRVMMMLWPLFIITNALLWPLMLLMFLLRIVVEEGNRADQP